MRWENRCGGLMSSRKADRKQKENSTHMSQRIQNDFCKTHEERQVNGLGRLRKAREENKASIKSKCLSSPAPFAKCTGQRPPFNSISSINILSCKGLAGTTFSHCTDTTPICFSLDWRPWQLLLVTHW